MPTFIFSASDDEGINWIEVCQAPDFETALKEIKYYPFDLKNDTKDGEPPTTPEQVAEFYGPQGREYGNYVDGDSNSQWTCFEVLPTGGVIVHGPVASQFPTSALKHWASYDGSMIDLSE